MVATPRYVRVLPARCRASASGHGRARGTTQVPTSAWRRTPSAKRQERRVLVAPLAPGRGPLGAPPRRPALIACPSALPVSLPRRTGGPRKALNRSGRSSGCVESGDRGPDATRRAGRPCSRRGPRMIFAASRRRLTRCSAEWSAASPTSPPRRATPAPTSCAHRWRWTRAELDVALSASLSTARARRRPRGGSRAHEPDRWENLFARVDQQCLELLRLAGGAAPCRSDEVVAGACMSWPLIAAGKEVALGDVRTGRRGSVADHDRIRQARDLRRQRGSEQCGSRPGARKMALGCLSRTTRRDPARHGPTCSIASTASIPARVRENWPGLGLSLQRDRHRARVVAWSRERGGRGAASGWRSRRTA